MNQDKNFFAAIQKPSAAELERQEQLKDRLKTIIRIVSGRPEIEVTTVVDPRISLQMASQGQDAEQTWFHTRQYDPITKEKVKEFIHVPGKVMEASENVAKGKAAHEAGHAAITRFGEFIPDEVLQELGFHSLMAATEELPTDQVVRERYEGAGGWVDEARGDSIKDASFGAELGRKMIGVPKFGQFCDLVVYGRHFEKIPDYYDKDVVKLYKKHEKVLRDIERILPKEGADEEEVVKKAKERYKKTYAKIWQDVKKLVQQDLEKKKIEQMLSEAEKEGQSQKDGKKEAQSDLQKALDELPENLKKELKKLMEDLKKKEQKPKIQQGENKEVGQSEEKYPEGESGQSKDGDGYISSKKSSTGKQEENPEQKEISREKSSGIESPITSSQEHENESEIETAPQRPPQMSQELLDKLKKIFAELPEDIKREIEKQAKKSLEELEDSVVKKMQGKLEETPAETHTENQKRIEAAAQASAEKKEMAKIEKKIASLRESSSVYDEVYKDVLKLDRKLYGELEELFIPNLKSKASLRSTGTRLNLPAVFRWEADKGAGIPVVNTRIFETIKNPEKRDYVITILVDLSGSMGNGTIEETFKGVVLLTEVLNRLGIKNEILGFQDELIIFKEFSDILNDDVRRKIAGMIAEVYEKNPGGNNNASYNDDGPCLSEASRRLAEYEGKEKIIMVLSDGKPEGRRSNEGDLHRAIDKILSMTDQKLIGIGLGENTEHVKKFYPVSLPSIDTSKLAETLGGLLKDLIENPRKYDKDVK